jgi:hypothetical protein
VPAPELCSYVELASEQQHAAALVEETALPS